jgi:hypothetical protein
MEKILPIIGYEGIYSISNYGYAIADECFKKRGRYNHKRPAMILKPSVKRNGYLQVRLQKGKVSKYIAIHCLVALHFIPNPEYKKTVNHKDGNKKNNNVNNLEWFTNKEQINHADITGLRDIKGEKNKLSKFKNADIHKIRASSLSITELAKLYNVNRTCIHKIKNKQTWKHI